MGFGILILIAVALSTSLGTYLRTQREPRICGGKFEAIGSKCYYIESDNEQVWLGALYQCSRVGGHLASIQSQQELDDISKELMPNKEYYIDISDQISGRNGFLSATTGLAPSFIHQNLDDSWDIYKRCAFINHWGRMGHSGCHTGFFVCEKHEPATQEQKQKIEQNFKKIGEKYYYIEKNKKRTWMDAFHKCQELGGHLATPRNDMEFINISKELPIDSGYFIDLSDQLNEGQFVSISTGSKDNYFSWGIDEPKIQYGKVVVIEKTSWSTYMRHESAYESNFFICEALI